MLKPDAVSRAVLKNLSVIKSNSFIDIWMIGQMKKWPLPPSKAKEIKTEGDMQRMAQIFA